MNELIKYTKINLMFFGVLFCGRWSLRELQLKCIYIYCNRHDLLEKSILYMITANNILNTIFKKIYNQSYYLTALFYITALLSSLIL